MAKKRQSAIELARSSSSEVERMAGSPLYLVDDSNDNNDNNGGEDSDESTKAQLNTQGLAPIIASIEGSVKQEISDDDEQGIKVNDITLEPMTDGTPAEERLYRLRLQVVRVGGINTRVIDEESQPFKELVESIQKDGQLAPILVGIEGDHYRLIAGERRYRAVRAAGLDTVLARVTKAPASEWHGLMLIENLMRQDLSVWEEAAGYKALLAMGLTQEQVGARVHKGKTHVSLILKIMRNPTIVAAVEEGTITSESMAKELSALVNANGQEIIHESIENALEFIAKRGPTVQELRAWVRTLTRGLQETDEGKKARRGSKRGTFLKSEQLHLNAVVEKISELSSGEISILAQIYEKQANILRKLSEESISAP